MATRPDAPKMSVPLQSATFRPPKIISVSPTIADARKEPTMSESQAETFTERVDVSTQPDGRSSERWRSTSDLATIKRNECER
jgi:hypothetical protein